MRDTEWLSRYPVMPTKDFERIFQKWKALPPGKKRDRLRATLVEGNVRLIAKIAARYLRRAPLEINELIAAGSIGLMRALERFDHTHGVSFATYGSYWIRHAIQDEIRNSCIGKSVQIPVNRAQLARSLRRLSDQFQVEHGRKPSAEELTDLAIKTGKKTHANCQPHTVKRTQEAVLQITISLDAPVQSEEGARKWHDILPDQSKDPRQVLLENERIEQLMHALETLDPRQKTVLKKLFGLNGELQKSMQEVGDELGLSRERIRQIEALACRRLRIRCQKARLDS